MKRLTLAVLAGLALVLGLVAGPAANAGDPYPGTVRTTTKVSAPNAVKAGKKVTIKVTVRTPGTVQARGVVRIKVKGPGGFSKSVQRAYRGRPVSYGPGKLTKPGKYKVTATFQGGDSVFKDSKDTDSITVKKRKK